MKWSVKGIELLRSPLGVMVVIPAPHDNDLSQLDKDKEYVIEIKKKSKSRSMNANACGHFTYVPVREDAVERYITIWQAHGIGWIAEDAGECKSIKGYHNIMCYHGSSVYTVAEMQRLIDCLVDECNQLGIKLDDSDYIQSLVKEWGNEQAKKE